MKLEAKYKRALRNLFKQDLSEKELRSKRTLFDVLLETDLSESELCYARNAYLVCLVKLRAFRVAAV